jgi:uncharacterized phage protein (TIGR02216 family)
VTGAAPAAFPWDEAIALCLGRLGLAPAAFWALTPRELAIILSGLRLRRPPADHLTQTELQALAARYPDEPPLEEVQHEH